MRRCICLYTLVPDEPMQDVRYLRHPAGGIVPIHGFILSCRGDD